MSVSSKTAPVYLVVSGEMAIDASPAQTWPHVVNYPSWQNYSTVQTIEGTPGEEGEVVVLRKDEAGFVFPPYHARTIKIEPQRKIIWKTYLDPGAGEPDGFGIVEFRLYPRGEQTLFWYNLIYEFQVTYREERELEEFRRMQASNFAALIAATHPKLKQLVEASRKGAVGR